MICHSIRQVLISRDTLASGSGEELSLNTRWSDVGLSERVSVPSNSSSPSILSPAFMKARLYSARLLCTSVRRLPVEATVFA